MAKLTSYSREKGTEDRHGIHKGGKGNLSMMLSKMQMLSSAASDTLQSLLDANNLSAGATEILWALGLGVAVGFLISLTYIITHRKDGYSQSYVLTVLLLPPIVAIVLVLINSAASALSLAGVFTLCRYRTIPADPKDVTYVFFSMASGVICGIDQSRFIVFVFFAVIAAILILVEFLGYGKSKTKTMLLKITIPENLNYNGLFDEILNEFSTSWKLKRVKTESFGTLFELDYILEMKDAADQKALIDAVRQENGNLTVVLSLYRYEDMVADA